MIKDTVDDKIIKLTSYLLALKIVEKRQSKNKDQIFSLKLKNF